MFVRTFCRYYSNNKIYIWSNLALLCLLHERLYSVALNIVCQVISAFIFTGPFLKWHKWMWTIHSCCCADHYINDTRGKIMSNNLFIYFKLFTLKLDLFSLIMPQSQSYLKLMGLSYVLNLFLSLLQIESRDNPKVEGNKIKYSMQMIK